MKKSILIALMFLMGIFAGPVRAEPGPLTLLLAGSGRSDSFRISLSPDGRRYLIFSAAPLEAGGDICSHPEERANELECNAPAISGLEVNAAGGSDRVTFTIDIPVPVTVRGGPGEDKLIGGPGNNTLIQ